MIHLSARHNCDVCPAPATIETDRGDFFCDACNSSRTQFEIPSAVPMADVNASPVNPTPGPAGEATNPVAKATEGKAGTAVVTGHVRRSTAGSGLRVGEADAVRSDGGERPAPNSSSCGVEGSHDLKSSGIDDGKTFDGSHTVAAPRSRLAGIASGPQDSNPTTASLVSETRGAISSPLVAPPFSSNTPEASGTARKAPCGALLGASSRNDSSRLVTSSVLDFEAEVSALEAEWSARGIVMNATTFLVSVMSDNKSKSATTGA